MADLVPNDSQGWTLIALPIIVFAVAFLWFTPQVSQLLDPLKVITTGIHECFHVGAGIARGGEITKIEVDTKAGGDTDMNGGIPCLTLPAGYVGSICIGAIFIFCGFSGLASVTIAGFILTSLCGPLLKEVYFKQDQAWDWLALGSTLLHFAVIITSYVLYFIYGTPLIRFVVLLVGCSNASVYGLMWGAVSVAVMVGAVLGAIAKFK